MSDAVMPLPEVDACLSDATALRSRLDSLVELAWEPGWAPIALGRLVALCAQLQRQQDAAGWEAARATLRGHPLRRLAHEDPFTRQAFEAPGTPATQAALLDLLLRRPGTEGVLAGASRAGRDLFAVTTELRYPAALRARTRFLARIIHAVAERRPDAEILTLEAGLLREAAELDPDIRLGRWVALNTDAGLQAGLREFWPQASQSRLPLRIRRGSLPGLIRRPYRHGCFDLITLAQLPEDGSPALLRNLVDAAFAALKPDGLLVLGAAAEAPPEAAWMDAFMDWRPRWRSPDEMEALLNVIPPEECSRRQVFHSLDGRLLQAHLRKRS
jgi:SAM-dependent methyltransferase